MKWFVKPEVVRLPLVDGEWIEVKKELTKGERDKVNAMLIREVRADGRMSPDLEMMSKAEVLAYLVDWSLVNNGTPVRIDTDADKLSAINQMPIEAFDLIAGVVSAHVARTEAENAGKKDQGGERGSSPTSASAA
jgi:hypothetical protein